MQKLFVGGGGFEGVTTPDPPENFNHTLRRETVQVRIYIYSRSQTTREKF